MSPHPSKGGPSKGPTQRQLRVAELIRHEIAAVLARGDVHDPVLARHIVTIAEVRLSPDLKLATAYVMPLGGGDLAPVLKALAANAKVLRTEVARRVNLKFAPELRFRADETFDEATRIDRLLRSERVRRDLEAGESEDGDESDAPTPTDEAPR